MRHRHAHSHFTPIVWFQAKTKLSKQSVQAQSTQQPHRPSTNVHEKLAMTPAASITLSRANRRDLHRAMAAADSISITAPNKHSAMVEIMSLLLPSLPLRPGSAPCGRSSGFGLGGGSSIWVSRQPNTSTVTDLRSRGSAVPLKAIRFGHLLATAHASKARAPAIAAALTPCEHQ
jgi:hypothetical protein